MGSLAAEFYRVERIQSDDVKSASSQAKEMLKFYLLGRRGPARSAHDLVRIFNRAGAVVFEREWSDRRGGARQENDIIEDLLHLEVGAFRAKWGIAEREPPGGDHPSPET